ncbi:MAG: MFS transporter [Pseudomonadota bacterium]
MTRSDQSAWGAGLTALVCGSLILLFSLGIRHSFGLFLQPISAEQGWGRETFAFGVAVQNLVWGVNQPLTGMLADRFGATRLAILGAVLYAAGVAAMALVTDPLLFAVTSGVLIGLALSATTFPVIFGTVSRLVTPERRSQAMGIVMAVGSFGQFILLPGALGLVALFDWTGALLALAAMSLLMAPLALGLKEPPRPAKSEPQLGARAALKQAAEMRDFWLLGLGFFACGFQVVFIGTHLPAFLADEGIDVNVATIVLALIGLVNIVGAYSAGILGSHHRKPMLLAWIYLARAALIAGFVLAPVTAASAYAFGALMGLFWLSTVPLTNGTVASIWGVKHMSMLGGFVFLAHQLGSFLGGWMGGLIYDATGSYDIAWGIAIAVSLVAAVLNWPIRETPAAARRVPAR